MHPIVVDSFQDPKSACPRATIFRYIRTVGEGKELWIGFETGEDMRRYEAWLENKALPSPIKGSWRHLR